MGNKQDVINRLISGGRALKSNNVRFDGTHLFHYSSILARRNRFGLVELPVIHGEFSYSSSTGQLMRELRSSLDKIPHIKILCQYNKWASDYFPFSFPDEYSNEYIVQNPNVRQMETWTVTKNKAFTKEEVESYFSDWRFLTPYLVELHDKHTNFFFEYNLNAWIQKETVIKKCEKCLGKKKYLYVSSSGNYQDYFDCHECNMTGKIIKRKHKIKTKRIKS